MEPEPSRKGSNPLRADWKLDIGPSLVGINPASGKRKTEDERGTRHTLQTKGTLASTAQSSQHSTKIHQSWSVKCSGKMVQAKGPYLMW